MPDTNFTPYAIVPNKKYSEKDLKNDFGYKGQPDQPLEEITFIEDALLAPLGMRAPMKPGVPR
jgi:hypothetical protein